MNKITGRFAVTEEARKAISARRKELRAAIKKRRKNLDLATSNAGEFALDRLKARLGSRVTESDVDALPQAQRVLEKGKHDELVKKEQRRAERASAVMASAADARRELLRIESCEALLERAPRIESPIEAEIAVEEATLEGSAAALASLR